LCTTSHLSDLIVCRVLLSTKGQLNSMRLKVSYPVNYVLQYPFLGVLVNSECIYFLS